MSTPAPVRVWESRYLVLRRIWRTDLLLNFVQPLMYLLGIGLGVGSLVDRRIESTESLGGIDYVAYLGPGLMATTAMIIGSFEALWPVLSGFKWSGEFEAMAATSITPRQIVNGQMLWWATRLGIAVVGVAVVLALHPDTRSWGILPAVPVAVLCGLAFAMVIGSWSSTREYDSSFSNVPRLVITPLFLFGGAFYPIDSLPAGLRPIAWFTPLWHAVEACRGFQLGTLGFGEALLHIGILVAFVVAGWFGCRRAFERRLYR